MKNRYCVLISSLICILVIFQTSCREIVDRDMSNEQLKITNPADSFRSSNYTIVFLWEELHYNTQYRLQIVQPNFNNIQQYVLDTLITGTKFVCTLFPGTYQWRMRAENGSSATSFITRMLRVDSNVNLNGQAFQVLTPSDNYAVNTTTINFVWNAFPYADVYEYVLTDSNNNPLRYKQTSSVSLSDTIYEGKYFWKIRALDTLKGTATNFSQVRSLLVDMTPPAPSLPSLPINAGIDSNSVVLSWIRSDDIYADSLFVGNDSNFVSIVTVNLLIGKNTYTLGILTKNQAYYWKLRSRDVAGNWSVYSKFFKFYYQ